jgi:hypothetical protein
MRSVGCKSDRSGGSNISTRKRPQDGGAQIKRNVHMAVMSSTCQRRGYTSMGGRDCWRRIRIILIA